MFKKLLFIFLIFSGIVAAQYRSQFRGGQIDSILSALNFQDSLFRINRLLVYDGDLDAAMSRYNDQGNGSIPFLNYKALQNWFPAMRNEINIGDDNFVGNTHIVAQANYAWLRATSGQQDYNITGLYNVAWNGVSGSLTWGTYGSLISSFDNLYTNATAGKVPAAVGNEIFISAESGANDSWGYLYGVRLRLNPLANGLLHIDTIKTFYSDLVDKNVNTTFDGAYHFYGLGNYPSYFGGKIQVGQYGSYIDGNQSNRLVFDAGQNYYARFNNSIRVFDTVYNTATNNAIEMYKSWELSSSSGAWLQVISNTNRLKMNGGTFTGVLVGHRNYIFVDGENTGSWATDRANYSAWWGSGKVFGNWNHLVFARDDTIYNTNFGSYNLLSHIAGEGDGKLGGDYIGYYSGIDAGVPISTATVYHFYGAGNWPSYLGGDLEADGDVIKFENMPSDSTGLNTGELYFDSNGFVKRKF